MPIEILMPALSPTMEEGKLSKWFVKEGDAIKPGDIIAEIETDKAVMDFEAVEDGLIKNLLVKDGTEDIKINTPIAILELEGEIKQTTLDIDQESKAGSQSENSLMLTEKKETKIKPNTHNKFQQCIEGQMTLAFQTLPGWYQARSPRFLPTGKD